MLKTTQVIDTTKFEFGRYYKFDIPATVKKDIKAGAGYRKYSQPKLLTYYNPTELRKLKNLKRTN